MRADEEEAVFFAGAFLGAALAAVVFFAAGFLPAGLDEVLLERGRVVVLEADDLLGAFLEALVLEALVLEAPVFEAPVLEAPVFEVLDGLEVLDDFEALDCFDVFSFEALPLDLVRVGLRDCGLSSCSS